jgi:hypothetical protein
MLRACWPDLAFIEVGQWLFLPGYPLPAGLWDQTAVDVAIQIPLQLPGEAPYGFYVRPGLRTSSGDQPTNYTHPANEPPLPGTWGKFSWAPVSWQPRASATAGDNMVGFTHSVALRLAEGN